MTRPLYHDDSTQLAFTAQVSAVSGTDLALDATAFYPGGGGQPSDTGKLFWNGQEAQVTAARKDKETGIIWHTLRGELPPVGSEIAGGISPETRWRHTQRHSAEHLLAQAFTRVSSVFQVAAVSMNSPQCHLDLTGSPAEVHVLAAEKWLRETLGRDELTLETRTVPDTELRHYPLRRAPKVSGQLRLVMFRDSAGQYAEVSACGGTHVPRAAMCAPVVILRTENIRGGLTRVTFVAGEEASEYLGGVYREARTLAQDFSVSVEKLPGRVAALKAERDTLKAATLKLYEQLALELLAAAPLHTAGHHTVRFLELAELALLPPVLSAGPRPGEIVVALAPEGRCGVASGDAAVHAGDLLRSALAVTGGKGGGKADLAQGSTAQPAAFLAAVRTLLSG